MRRKRISQILTFRNFPRIFRDHLNVCKRIIGFTVFNVPVLAFRYLFPIRERLAAIFSF
ncbi:hypothetical protein C7S17_0927 [Burkholderia thailandensis]|nr:hypothetical protein [Burkholderia thailandensis]